MDAAQQMEACLHDECQECGQRSHSDFAVEWIARAGYPVNGILHLLIAYLIVRIALGFGGDADQTGALATLANSGGGALPLWIVAGGLIALAMWRFAEAVMVCTRRKAPTLTIASRQSATGSELSVWASSTVPSLSRPSSSR